MKKVHLVVLLSLVSFVLAGCNNTGTTQIVDPVIMTQKVVTIMTSDTKPKFNSQTSCEKVFERTCESQYNTTIEVTTCKSLKTQGCNKILKKK